MEASELRRDLDGFAPHAVQQARHALIELRREREEFYDTIPTVMVMKEGAPRDAFILKRGAYDAHLERVSAGLPHVLPPLPEGAPNNRLGLARWLVDPGNPLTARVAVNRSWQLFFGAGMVKTTEDFGVQGEKPTHPELFDWLARDFMDSGWDVKHMLRLMVADQAKVGVNIAADDTAKILDES